MQYFVIFAYAERPGMLYRVDVVSTDGSVEEAKEFAKDQFRCMFNQRVQSHISARTLFTTDDPAKADEFYNGFVKTLQDIGVSF